MRAIIIRIRIRIRIKKGEKSCLMQRSVLIVGGSLLTTYRRRFSANVGGLSLSSLRRLFVPGVKIKGSVTGDWFVRWETLSQ
jgi:hypothetical protein